MAGAIFLIVIFAIVFLRVGYCWGKRDRKDEKQSNKSLQNFIWSYENLTVKDDRAPYNYIDVECTVCHEKIPCAATKVMGTFKGGKVIRIDADPADLEAHKVTKHPVPTR
jgi:hypothetical protein